MDEKKRESTPEEQAALQEFAELVLEAMETLFKEGLWVPGRGIVGLEDTLDTTLLSEKDQKGSTP